MKSKEGENETSEKTAQKNCTEMRCALPFIRSLSEAGPDGPNGIGRPLGSVLGRRAMETSDLFTSETRRDARRLLKEYGENLNRRRKERGVTRMELSERTGVSCKDIDDAERGLEGLSEEEKQRIEDFLLRQRII